MDRVARDPSPEKDDRLNVLICDYEMAREDERTLVNTQATLFSAAVTLVGLLAAAVTQAPQVPEVVLAAAPLIPYAIFAYLTIIGVSATIRSYYLRAIESELQTYAPGPLIALGEQVPPASFVGITIEATSLRIGRGRLGYRLLNLIILLIILVVFGGLTYYIGTKVSVGVRALMVAVYVPAVSILAHQALTNTIGGRGLFVSVATRYLARQALADRLPQVSGAADPARTDERRLASYLILPRPEDCVKWAIAPAVFAISCLSTDSWSNWYSFVGAWVILEYLIYEARYQWNDICGMWEDEQHAERSSRGRLPVGHTRREAIRNVSASASVIAVRLIAAVAAGVALHLGPSYAVIFLAVFAVGTLYEGLRRWTGSSHIYSETGVRSIWLTVGLGYVVRAEIGFLAGGIPLAGYIGIAGALFLWALGMMFVLMTWALEATSFCVSDTSGRWRAMRSLRDKPHIAALLPYLGRYPHYGTASATDGSPDMRDLRHSPDYCCQLKILERWASPRSPWNISLYLGAVAGAIFGDLLAARRTGDVVGWSTISASAVTALLWAIFLSTTVGAVRQAGVVMLGGISLALMAWFGMSPGLGAVLISAPFVSIGAMYLFFRNSSYKDLKSFGSNIRTLGKRVSVFLVVLLRIVIGEQTWRRLAVTPAAERTD